MDSVTSVSGSSFDLCSLISFVYRSSSYNLMAYMNAVLTDAKGFHDSLTNGKAVEGSTPSSATLVLVEKAFKGTYVKDHFSVYF